ncbi:MAG TPA: 5'/3'-nucleotidase SurE [bacterium]|nr:5'/3'-nucleotidase SurE [bacterium]HMY34897.1 5'/3'-nucleotidase SurE [bacterium]HMZ03782.1 5'/3'-nucleotidase SurE [bacterium]HNB07928.1 5'/3'-nucleotidase SurE [bacterium]HND77056.1 5'/3'-nucleotidase SurE [bacterium]
MKHILLTNDDGIDANGIFALYKELKKLGDVTVVAPQIERSAVGHAITIHDPIRVLDYHRPEKFKGYAISGTPADCVKIGVKNLVHKKPDLIVSGINHGSNTATNVLYSGTVSAATEGIIMGIPSIASSMIAFDHKTDLTFAAEITAKIARIVLDKGLPSDTLLNINIPPGPRTSIKGIAVTRQGRGRYEEEFEQRTDLSGRAYYWLTGKKMILDHEDDVDDVVVLKNKVSVTPIQIDLTAHKFLDELKTWNIEI